MAPTQKRKISQQNLELLEQKQTLTGVEQPTHNYERMQMYHMVIILGDRILRSAVDVVLQDSVDTDLFPML